jgi:hypothetical protein
MLWPEKVFEVYRPDGTESADSKPGLLMLWPVS